MGTLVGLRGGSNLGTRTRSSTRSERSLDVVTALELSFSDDGGDTLNDRSSTSTGRDRRGAVADTFVVGSPSVTPSWTFSTEKFKNAFRGGYFCVVRVAPTHSVEILFVDGGDVSGDATATTGGISSVPCVSSEPSWKSKSPMRSFDRRLVCGASTDGVGEDRRTGVILGGTRYSLLLGDSLRTVSVFTLTRRSDPGGVGVEDVSFINAFRSTICGDNSPPCNPGGNTPGGKLSRFTLVNDDALVFSSSREIDDAIEYDVVSDGGGGGGGGGGNKLVFFVDSSSSPNVFHANISR